MGLKIFLNISFGTNIWTWLNNEIMKPDPYFSPGPDRVAKHTHLHIRFDFDDERKNEKQQETLFRVRKKT